MTNRIFEAFAPHYWAVGLPVIPLRERDKMPVVNGWTEFGTRMPDVAEQEHWLVSFRRGNIGLPFGSASGLCAIDIDTEDAELDAAIREICGATPYVRIGKKGAGLIYRWEGQNNFKLRDASGGMLCEFLGLGNQMVLPPSIHPDCSACGTKNAAGPNRVCTSCGHASIVYEANANLWEVLDSIPSLPSDIERRLSASLGTGKTKAQRGGRSAPLDVVPAGQRDVQMIKMAGYLANVVLGIDKTAKFTLADAIEHMRTWAREFTAPVSGDEIDPEKGVAKLIEFLGKDVAGGRVLPRGWDQGLPQHLLDDPAVITISATNETQSWTVARMVSELTSACADRAEDRDWVEEKVGEIVAAAASDPSIGEYQVRCFHERVSQCYGEYGIKWAALKAVYKESRAAIEHKEDFADHYAVACAVLADLERSGEIRFDELTFWQWIGSHWSKMHEDDIYLHIAETVRGALIVRKDSDYSAVVRLLRKKCRTRLSEQHVVGVNFANGFFTEEAELLPHNPEHGCTFTLPFDYMPERAESCPEWLAFLKGCWGHEPDFDDRVMALQEAFAATMLGLGPAYQRAFLLFGQGGSGKSQILRVLEALLPDAACASLSPELWDGRFHLTHLIGTAANLCNELPEQGRIKGSIFKQVVEGSKVFTEYKCQDGFGFWPRCAHWFASNFLPATRDSSDGFARRWLILDFNKRIPEASREPDLGARIVANEREAIAAWALAAVGRLRHQEGYTLPECHRLREAQMRIANNSVLEFLRQSRCVQEGDGRMDVAELYDLYSSHMRDGKRGTPVRATSFELMLEELGVVLNRSHDGFGFAITHALGLRRRPIGR